MFSTAVTAALTGVAKTLREQARNHKRLELHHRRQAGRLQRQYDRLTAMCEAHGIELTPDTDTDPDEEGSQS
jgi:hypothetical protein